MGENDEREAEAADPDDPFFKKRSPEDIARENAGRGGSGITTPHRDSSGTWHVTRDIYLGKTIPGYTACTPNS